MYCTVGFVDDDRPVVIPTIHVRVGDTVVLHGSPASRMLRILKGGAPCAIAVTLLDGLVLARSVFNHSMNYRSVVLFGTATPIDDPERKLEAMRGFTEKILPGRWGDARVPSEKEFRGTLMLGIPIDAASAKMRSGPPSDEPEDLTLPVWAGVIPLRTVAGAPVPSPDLPPGVEVPDYLRRQFGDG
ncbi:MAG: pyridoxamine 5'-phosphate oxidase family protein [Acidimicrobiia bacterium]|nr:pyridoxamine 5'-phosphate oxidase family protein [Acidimicrobiia bacterium]